MNIIIMLLEDGHITINSSILDVHCAVLKQLWAVTSYHDILLNTKFIRR